MEVLVRFRPSGRSVRVPRGTTLLEAAQRAKLPVASACGAEAVCGRCGMRILSGNESVAPQGEAEARVKRRNRVEATDRLACRVAPIGDVEVTARYW
ncbi:MAG: (2Fe-2S)-binding protein [Myxococcales bacterium]|nr:(2Fe-2S)-binding protein [Myxococcales bacterium]